MDSLCLQSLPWIEWRSRRFGRKKKQKHERKKRNVIAPAVWWNLDSGQNHVSHREHVIYDLVTCRLCQDKIIEGYSLHRRFKKKKIAEVTKIAAKDCVSQSVTSSIVIRPLKWGMSVIVVPRETSSVCRRQSRPDECWQNGTSNCHVVHHCLEGLGST